MRCSKTKYMIVFLSIILAFALIPTKTIMADTVASGDCGNKLTWSLDNSGTLTISGSGDMWNWNDKEVPWVDYRNDIRSVVFSGSITSIGRYAFGRCPNLTNVVIPSSVKTIGQWAFAFDYGLLNVVIPNGVTSIGWDAFRQCTSLTSVTIPNSVETIGDCQFYGCTKLKYVTLSTKLSYLDKQIFDGCTSLESVEIPSGVTSIGDKCFNGCKSLGSIIIPNDVTAIGTNAFSGCTGLTSIAVNKNVYSQEAFPELSADLFHYYYNITYTNDGNGTVSGKNKSFGTDVVDFKITPGSYYELDKLTLTNDDMVIELKPSLSGKYIMPDVDGNALINATFKPTVIDSGECGDGTNAGNVTWVLEGDGTLTISGNGGTRYYGEAYNPPWYKYRDKISKVKIIGNITRIGKKAFNGCTKIASVELPENLKYIGPYAFNSCSSLRNIVIPNSVTTIDAYAFYGTKLSRVSLPSDLTTIGKSAFCECSNLVSITIPNGVTKIQEFTFENCTSLQSVSIPNSVNTIERYAFRGCTKLSSVKIPDSVSSIGVYAFRGCTNLSAVTLPNSITSIGEWTFGDCSLLKSITIPQSVDSIGASAFNGCTNLTSVVFNEGLTTIGASAFKGCTSLLSVSIPESVTTISANAFKDCSSLYSVSIPIGVTTIGDSAFNSCNIKTLSISKSLYDKLDKSVFAYNPSITINYLYLISVYQKTGGIVEVSKTSAYYNDLITVTAKPSEGYKLSEIRAGGVIVEGNTFTMPDKSITVMATFTKINYAITVNSSTGGTAKVSKNPANFGDQITVTTTPDTGYEVDTITVNGTPITGTKFTMSAKDTAVDVTFKKSTYTISTTNVTNGTLKVSQTSACYGDTITVTATPAIGCKLSCIRVAGVIIDGNTFSMPAKNISVDATFTKIDYAITVNASTGGTAKVSKNPANFGDQITITTTPDIGYEVDTITINGNAITGINFMMGAEDTIVDVTFKKSTYTISTANVTNGTLKVSQTSACYGDTITVTATPATGYKVSCIRVAGVIIDGNTFSMPAKSITVDATFTKIDYAITVNASTGGTAKVSKNPANYGDQIAITTIVDAGYEVDTIKVNGIAITETYFTMGAGNTTVDVTFIKHVLTAKSTKDPTCTEDGHKAYYVCSRCHKLFSDADGKNEIEKPIAISKLGHSWATEGTVTKAPTCEDEGIMTCACTREGCSATTTKPISALGHSWDEGEITKEPTCEATGVKTFHCTRSGCKETKTESIKALGHKIIMVAEKMPNKTEPGNIKHYKCERCGKLFSDANGKNEITQAQTVIPATGHNLTEVKVKAATCTEPGNIAYYICKDDDCKCGKVYSDLYGQHEINIEDTVKPALGHNPVEVEGKNPTCTEDGYEKYYKCSRCHKLFSDAEGKNEIEKPIPISELGHDMKHVEAEKPTHDDDGHREYYHCDRCGKNFADEDGKTALTNAELVVPHIGAAVLGEEITEGDFIYKVTNPSTDGTGTVTVIGVANKIAAVIIPATVELKLDTYKVNRIGTKAFYGNKTITSLSIGSNVVIIDSYAFYGCSNLVKVSGGKALKSIGTKAFAYCSKLKSFSITSSVLNKIGFYAFQKDKKLKTVYIKYTTKLTKSGVKKSLKKSYVKTVKVKKSKVKKYKKYFKKSNSGRTVKVKK